MLLLTVVLVLLVAVPVMAQVTDVAPLTLAHAPSTLAPALGLTAPALQETAAADAPRWELSALQDLSFDGSGGILSYKLTDLGTTGYSIWADAGAFARYDEPKNSGLLGGSTNAPWPGKTLGNRLRWGVGLTIPEWGFMAYGRAVVTSW